MIYIGQSGTGNKNLRSRISHINRHANGDNADYPSKEMYAYAFVELPRNQLDIAENALIAHFRPKDNKQLKHVYKHSNVEVTMMISQTIILHPKGCENF